MGKTLMEKDLQLEELTSLTEELRLREKQI